jgi:O-antigen ligase
MRVPTAVLALVAGAGVAVALAAAFGGAEWAAAVALMAAALFLVGAHTRLALYFVAALIPVQITMGIAGLGVLPTVVASYGVFAMALAKVLCSRRVQPDPSKISLLLVLFVAAAFAAAVLGIDPGWSVTRLIHLGAYASLFLSAVMLMRSVEDAVLMIRVVMAVSIIVALVGIAFHLLQFVVGREHASDFLTSTVGPILLGAERVSALEVHRIWEPGVPGAPLRAVGPFLWPPVFAMYVELVLPLWLAGIVFGGERTSSIIWPGIVSGMLIFCVAATFVRGAWLTFPFAVAAMWYAAYRGGLRARPQVVGLVVTCVLVVFFASAVLGHGAFWERLRTTWQPDYASNLERLAIWRDATVVFRDHPVLGVGPGNFAAARYGRKASELARPHVNAHNMYLTTACETGIVGLAILLALYGRLIVCTLTAARRAADPRLRILASGLVGSFVWIGLNSLTDDALYEHRLFGVFWILAAAVAVIYRWTSARDAGQLGPETGIEDKRTGPQSSTDQEG